MAERKRRASARAAVRPEDPLAPPTDRQSLAKWVREVVGVELSSGALVEGHDAPLDYLAHAFFEESSPRDCVVWANRGGGKTFLGAVASVLDMVCKPGVQIRVLAGSLAQGGRMHAHLREMFERPALKGLVSGRATEKRIRLINGSCVELLAQSQAAVRGTRVQKIRCDEVELFDPEVWEAAQLATRSRCVTLSDGSTLVVRGAVEALSTMHRPSGLMQRIVDESRGPRATRRLFRWGVLDVLGDCRAHPACASESSVCALGADCGGRARSRRAFGHLELDDVLTMRGRVSRATWDAEMLCQGPSRSDAVLPEFDPRIHVVGGAPWEGREARWIGGMDFGIRAPTVVVWGVEDVNGSLWIVDERVKTGLVLEQHARAIMHGPWPELAWVGVDPAGGARSLQTGRTDIAELRRLGLRVRSARSNVSEGLERIRARLAPADGMGPRVFIHERCTELIRSLGNYHFDPSRPGSCDPVKDGFDHAVDALRYMVVNLERGVVRSGRYIGASAAWW